jgi:hypothetical protein
VIVTTVQGWKSTGPVSDPFEVPFQVVAAEAQGGRPPVRAVVRVFGQLAQGQQLAYGFGAQPVAGPHGGVAGHQAEQVVGARRTLPHWQEDTDLASVRDPQALDHLPDNEHAAWRALWRDVDELAKKVEPTQGRKEPQAPMAKP